MNFIPLLFYSISFLLIITYGYIIYFAAHGIKSSQKTQRLTYKELIPVDIVIAFHNEAKTLPQLIKGIASQTYQNIRIIWIDDHSNDRGLEIIQSQNKTNSISLESKLKGKKAAIQQAISHVSAPLILFTDADCQIPPNWVENYVNQYEQKGEGLFIGTVIYLPKKNLSKIFSLEFLSLVGTGIGLAFQKHPVYMNGANYAVSKKLIENTNKQSGQKYASGDDVFLLHDIKAQHGTNKIYTIPVKGNFVFTNAPETIIAFIKQRIRWGAKTRGYKDLEALLLAGLIFSICLLQIISFLFISQLLAFLSFWVAKSVIDFLALETYTKAFDQKKLLRWLPILAPLYPFYIVFTGITGIFTSTNYWGK